MTRLLVSVRNATEARLAVAAGVDLIDIKEPLAGSLGRAERTVIEDIMAAVAGRVPVSAALGELAEFELAALPLPPGVRYAKLGLAGCARQSDWRRELARAMERLPVGVERVAVIYADAHGAHAPEAAEVLALAPQLGFCAVLVDTFDKRAGGLLDHWTSERLGTMIGQVQSLGLLAVVAGSLTPPTIDQVLPLGPDFIAVRGAACQGPRTGTLCAERMVALGKQLRGTRAIARCDF